MSLNVSGVNIQNGMECLLNVTGRHFLVRIMDAAADKIRVSFPGRDYPVEGVPATLEFHDEDGFYYFPAEVIQGPAEGISGIMLRKSAEMKRSRHRDSFRAPTDLTVQVKEQIHVRRYNAALINLSAGGALIHTEALFDYSSLLELSLSLPGEPLSKILCKVIHFVEGPGINNRYYGLTFLDLDPQVKQAIIRYACQRLRDIYAATNPPASR